MIGTRREKENPLTGAKVKPGLRRAHSETERKREAHFPSVELARSEAAKRGLRHARRSASEDAGRRARFPPGPASASERRR